MGKHTTHPQDSGKDAKKNKVKKKKKRKKEKLAHGGVSDSLLIQPNSPNTLVLNSYPGGVSAAFFDVDNTLVQGASLVHYARGLARRDYFGYTELLGFVWGQLKFRISGKENHNDINAARDTAASFVTGRPTQEFADLGEELYEECIERHLWAASCEILQSHLKEGREVWLVTATPVLLAEKIAQKLGATGALGTVAESVDGTFTGRIIGGILHGQAKADAVVKLVHERKIDLVNSWAYSDSFNDLPLLSLVGNPVVINPDAQLRSYAEAHNWEIRDFRTARKAAKIGVPALLLGAAGGGAAAAVKLTRNK